MILDFEQRLENAGFTKYPSAIDDMYIDVQGNMVVVLRHQSDSAKHVITTLNEYKETRE